MITKTKLLFLVLTATFFCTSAFYPSLVNEQSDLLVGKWSTVPQFSLGVSERSPDGPLLGNGDMGVAVSASLYQRATSGGKPRYQDTVATYAVGLNQLNSIGNIEHLAINAIIDQDYPWMQSLGGLVVNFPSNSPFNAASVKFAAEQSILKANSVVSFTTPDGLLTAQITSIVDPNTNTLLTDFVFLNNGANQTTNTYEVTFSTYAFSLPSLAKQWGIWNTTSGILSIDGSIQSIIEYDVATSNDSAPDALYGNWVTKNVYGDGTYPVWGSFGSKITSGNYVITRVVGDGDSVNTTIRIAVGETITVVSRALTNLDVAGIDFSAPVRQYPGVGYPFNDTYINPISSLAPIMHAFDSPCAVALRNRHSSYWGAFWATAIEGAQISLPDDRKVEQYWYAHTYVMAMAGKVGAATPGLWGPWIYNDKSKWHGYGTWNYNQESPWWGMYSSNRLAQVNSQYSTILQYTPQAEINAEEFGNCSNALKWSVATSPLGFSGRLGGGGDLGMKSISSYAFLNFITHYDVTLDEEFLREKAYPNLVKLMNWWSCWLRKQTFDDGSYRYVDWFDCAWEQCNSGDAQPMNAFNPITGLSISRRIIASTIRFSIQLNLNAEERPLWQDILDHYSAFPVFQNPSVPSETVYSFAEDSEWVNSSLARSDDLHDVSFYIYGTGNANSRPTGKPTKILNMYPVWPTGSVSIHSNRTQSVIALNTIKFMNSQGSSFAQINNFPVLFPGAVRAGYPIRSIMNELYPLLDIKTSGYDEKKASYSLRNLFHAEGNGGFPETSGAIMAVNEMLVQGHEYAASLFPVWQADHRASFKGIRIHKAFLVSADYDGTTISDVQVYSEKGAEFSLFHPWAFSLKQREIQSYLKANITVPVNVTALPDPVGEFDPAYHVRVYIIDTSGRHLSEVDRHLITWSNVAPAITPESIHLYGGWDTTPSNETIWFKFPTIAGTRYAIVLDKSRANPLFYVAAPPNTCCYQFANPTLASFDLPRAQPNSPGDVTLNVNNPIRRFDGVALAQGCNSNSFRYYDKPTNRWLTSYVDVTGNTRSTIDNFYATGSDVKIRTIQTWQSNLATVLANRTVELAVQCNNRPVNCIRFTIGEVEGTNGNAYSNAAGTCTV